MADVQNVFQPGVLVNSRNRLWRVDSQAGNILNVTAIDESSRSTKLYLPIEEVAQAKLDLPSSLHIGSPQDQKLMVDAFRLSMVNSTTPLRSLQYSRAIPVPYQLVPVAMALEQERVRLLIADDVGLGKTIEAGLVVQELKARGMVRKILVVCPASLREQWREALSYFFHIEARVYSRENRRKLERDLPAGTNLLEFHDAFITSVDYAKSIEVKNLLLDITWDIVIIDEAHQVAKPHQSQPEHKVEKDRWQLAVDISRSKKVKHLLLLTATPHNGYTDSFASLIHLLDVGALVGPMHDPSIKKDIARHHIVQRQRSDVKEWLKDQLPERDQSERIIHLTPEEAAVIEAVQAYGDLILDSVKTAQKRMRVLAGWAVLHLHKRALSSPEALRCSLQNRKEGLLEKIGVGVTEEGGLTIPDARAYVVDESMGEATDSDDPGRRTETLAVGTRADIEQEIKALDDLILQAKKVTPSRDGKLVALTQSVLPEMLREKRKVIIFTKYRDTMKYVADQLNGHSKFADTTILTIDGTLNETQRYEQFATFAKAPKAVLVATDAISEGINLQHIASQIIHYELPWNPNRLEQRNGRVDRFGQKDPIVNIRTLVLDETLDAAILKLLVQKANQIREDYGFSPPYFGDETSILSLIRDHGMNITAGTKQLRLFDVVEPADETREDPFSEEMLERIRQDSFYGQSDLTLDYINEQIARTTETVGTRDAVQRFVFSALNRFNCRVSENADGTYRIAIQHPDLQVPGIPSEIKSATFDPARGQDDRDIEVFDLGHPLVRRLMDLIKHETFDTDRGSYGRTSAMLTDDVLETTALVTLLIRFVTDSTPAQIFEDLVPLALPVYDGQVLDADSTNSLSSANPAKGSLPEADTREVLTDLLGRDDLNQLIEMRVEERRQEILAERQEIRASLQRQAAWLDAAEKLNTASWDVLAVQILWPAK